MEESTNINNNNEKEQANINKTNEQEPTNTNKINEQEQANINKTNEQEPTNLNKNNEQEPTNINKINEQEPEVPKKEPCPCDFCNNSYEDLDAFSCNHKICSLCLFRRIFIQNIKEFNNSENQIEIKCKCKNGSLKKDIEELFEINNQKNNIYAEKLKSQNNISLEEKKLCPTHKDKTIKNYCTDCFKDICDDCISNNNNLHLNHNIFSNEYIINYLKKELNNTKLNLITKDDFEQKWNEICNKIKEETQNNFDETMVKIEEVAQAIIEFRKDYEEKYKNELTKIVKILKLYKLFYLDYYLEKKEADDTKDINLLRYASSISNELSDIEIKKDEKFFNKLDNIKDSLDNLKQEKINFSANFKFTEISKKYKIEQIIEKSHDKLINGIFEISNNKIITGSLDYTLKIWEEKNNKFENIKKIKGICGAICCMTKLNDGSIVTSAANNNNINIWTKQGEDNYVVKQSLSSHSKPVLTLAQLDNGKIVSGGWDNLIIIWDKDNSGCYIEKQRIKDKKPIMKIINLKNDKFAFTSDNRIRIMIQKKKQTNTNPKNDESKKNENNELLNDVFDDLEFDQDVEYEQDDENKFIVCYKLSKHTGRVRCMLELKNGYFLSGAGDAGKKKDNNILVCKPNDLDGFFYVQTLQGHLSDINCLIELKDGRVASSSKDRTIRIWKSFIKEDKNNQKVINFQIDEILSEFKHGIYGIIQLNDGRLFSSSSEFSLVVWKDRKFLSYC